MARHRGWLSGVLPVALAMVPVLVVPVTCAGDDATTPDALAHIDSLRIGYRPNEALAVIADELPGARAREDTSLVVALLLRQGSLLAAIGRAADAEPPLAEAESLAEATGDSLALCTALRWLAVAAAQLERHDEAAALNARLLAAATATGDHRHQGWALVGKASRSLTLGDHTSAESDFRRAIAHFDKAGTLDGRAWSWNALGIVRQRAGDYATALDCYETAAALAREDGNSMIESLALNNLGTLSYALGDPGMALDRFRRALAIQRRIGNLRGIYRPAVNVAICETDLGREREALAGLDSLLAECRRHHYTNLEGIIRNEQGRLSALAGHHHRAAAHYRQALALGDTLPVKTAAETHIGLAAALAATDSVAAALAILDQALSTLPLVGLAEQRLLAFEERGRLLARLGRPREALEQFIAAEREASRLGLERHRPRLLAQSARSYRAIGRPDSALSLLRRAASIWEADRALPLDPEWREQRGAAGHLIHSELAAAILATGESVGAEEDAEMSGSPLVRNAFDALQVFKARTLLERMSGPGPMPAALTPATARSLQDSVLRDGELLLDFYTGEWGSWLFAITRDSLRVVALPPDRVLERKLRDYYRLVAEPPRALPPAADAASSPLREHAARGLRRLLFAGVEDLIASSRLVFLAPDDCTNLLPAASLALNERAPLWARVPSATVLAWLRDSPSLPEPGSGPRILALAGGGPTPGGGAGTGARLPGTERETRHLARTYRGVTRHLPAGTGDGNSAGQSAAGVLAGYDLLHFAAHTTIDDQHPWHSAIHLGIAAETTGARELRASQIAGSHLSARLAVLAGCASATGRVVSGEGVLGLGSAFLSAGVPAVVATLWPVDDRTTARFMEIFYENLATGDSVAGALADAQRALRGEAATAPPFYWAGFVVIGDGAVEVDLLRREPQTSVIVLLSLIALAVIAAWIALRAAASKGPGARRPRDTLTKGGV